MEAAQKFDPQQTPMGQLSVDQITQNLAENQIKLKFCIEQALIKQKLTYLDEIQALVDFQFSNTELLIQYGHMSKEQVEGSQRLIEDQKHQIVQQNVQLIELKQEMANYTDKIRKMEQVNKEMDSSFFDHQHQVESLNNQIKKLQGQNEDLSAKIMEYSKFDNMTEDQKNDANEQKIASLNEQIESMNCHIGDLKQLDDRNTQQIQELQSKNQEWENFTKKLFNDIKERQKLRKIDTDKKMQQINSMSELIQKQNELMEDKTRIISQYKNKVAELNMETVFGIQESTSKNQGSQGGPIVNDEQVLFQAAQEVEQNIEGIVNRSNAYDKEVHQSMQFIDQKIRETGNQGLMSPDEQPFEIFRQQRHDESKKQVARRDTMLQPQAAQAQEEEETPGGYDFAPQDAPGEQSQGQNMQLDVPQVEDYQPQILEFDQHNSSVNQSFNANVRPPPGRVKQANLSPQYAKEQSQQMGMKSPMSQSAGFKTIDQQRSGSYNKRVYRPRNYNFQATQNLKLKGSMMEQKKQEGTSFWSSISLAKSKNVEKQREEQKEEEKQATTFLGMLGLGGAKKSMAPRDNEKDQYISQMAHQNRYQQDLNSSVQADLPNHAWRDEEEMIAPQKKRGRSYHKGKKYY